MLSFQHHQSFFWSFLLDNGVDRLELHEDDIHTVSSSTVSSFAFYFNQVEARACKITGYFLFNGVG